MFTEDRHWNLHGSVSILQKLPCAFISVECVDCTPHQFQIVAQDHVLVEIGVFCFIAEARVDFVHHFDDRNFYPFQSE